MQVGDVYGAILQRTDIDDATRNQLCRLIAEMRSHDPYVQRHATSLKVLNMSRLTSVETTVTHSAHLQSQFTFTRTHGHIHTHGHACSFTCTRTHTNSTHMDTLALNSGPLTLSTRARARTLQSAGHQTLFCPWESGPSGPT